MSELSDKIELYCNDKINSLEADMQELTFWCSESADYSYKIKEYKNIVQWLHNKKGCVDVSDVDNFLSLNIESLDKELKKFSSFSNEISFGISYRYICRFETVVVEKLS